MTYPIYDQDDLDAAHSEAKMLWKTIEKIYKFIKEKKDPEYMAMFDDAMGMGYAAWDTEE